MCQALEVNSLMPTLCSMCSRDQLSESKASVQFSRSVVSDSFRPHESQHARPPCPSQTPRVYSNSCPLSWWCHPAVSSSVVPFSSCPQSLQASGSFPVSQLFTWGGQSIGVSASASVLPMNTQDLSPYINLVLLHACVLSRFNCVGLFATPWTVTCQDSLFMGFFRQGY